MPEQTFDDPELPVSSDPPERLGEQVFGLYRQLVRERENGVEQAKTLAHDAGAQAARFRERLAALGAEAFHLRRTVGSVRERMLAAGLERELGRMELMLKRFDQVLESQAVRVESLDGRDVDDALAELIDVESFVNAPVERARVRQTLEPLVVVDELVVRRPKVITEVPE